VQAAIAVPELLQGFAAVVRVRPVSAQNAGTVPFRAFLSCRGIAAQTIPDLALSPSAEIVRNPPGIPWSEFLH